MFGDILGAVLSAPVRMLNVPVKIAEKAAEAADEFMIGSYSNTYRAPRKNSLDSIAEAIEDSCQEALDR